mmetsp:Transcript_26195/g.52499  ORF Transcript_26195/g.52499 Transcript_26195/m.52499 type:complete len:201 (-) Transcript_26195:342-944(-)
MAIMTGQTEGAFSLMLYETYGVDSAMQGFPQLVVAVCMVSAGITLKPLLARVFAGDLPPWAVPAFDALWVACGCAILLPHAANPTAKIPLSLLLASFGLFCYGSMQMTVFASCCIIPKLAPGAQLLIHTLTALIQNLGRAIAAPLSLAVFSAYHVGHGALGTNLVAFEMAFFTVAVFVVVLPFFPLWAPSATAKPSKEMA